MPEASEAPHFHMASFRVGKKIFCTMDAAKARIMLKFDPEDQYNLVAGEPDAIAPVPGAWGRKGATHVQYEKLDLARLEPLIRLAWATVAPRRLSKVSGRA